MPPPPRELPPPVHQNQDEPMLVDDCLLELVDSFQPVGSNQQNYPCYGQDTGAGAPSFSGSSGLQQINPLGDVLGELVNSNQQNYPCYGQDTGAGAPSFSGSSGLQQINPLGDVLGELVNSNQQNYPCYGQDTGAGAPSFSGSSGLQQINTLGDVLGELVNSNQQNYPCYGQDTGAGAPSFSGSSGLQQINTVGDVFSNFNNTDRVSEAGRTFSAALGELDQRTNPVSQSNIHQHHLDVVPESDEQFSPYLEILTQPEEERRFRYSSEGNNGPLLGIDSSLKRKTYPRVKLHHPSPSLHAAPIKNIFVRCELYTHTSNPDHHSLHVHKFKQEINVGLDNDYTVEFKNLIIIRSKIKDWRDILLTKKQKYQLLQNLNDEQIEREIEREIASMDPTKVRLCFEAYIKDPVNGSEESLTKKKFSDIILAALPKIERKNLSRGQGDDEMWLIVDNIKPKETTVRFLVNDQRKWSADVTGEDFKILHGHVIIFRTPMYPWLSAKETEAKIQLIVREINGVESKSTTDERFIYTSNMGPSGHYIPVGSDYSQPTCSSVIEGLSHNIKDEEYIQAPKEAYENVLNLWESKDPNRLQDIKAILRAKGKGMGPLQAAAWYGQYENLQNLVDFILQKLNMKWLINTEDDSRQTPLTIAIKRGNTDCAKILKEAGAQQPSEDHQKQKHGLPTLCTETEEVGEDRMDSDNESEVDEEDSFTSTEEENEVDVEDSCKSTEEKKDVGKHACNADKGVVRENCSATDVVKDGVGNQIKVEQLESDDVKLTENLQNMKI